MTFYAKIYKYVHHIRVDYYLKPLLRARKPLADGVVFFFLEMSRNSKYINRNIIDYRLGRVGYPLPPPWLDFLLDRSLVMLVYLGRYL